MRDSITDNNIGIWIDKKVAHIVRCRGSKATLNSVYSDLEFYNPKGGSRSKTRWGPQQVVHDKKYLEREKNQLKAYFEKVIAAILNADSIAIYGPAETYLKLHAELKKHAKLHDKITLVSRSDSMSNNQFKALVKEFYGTPD